ncbi:M20/M25/M40 family metallo-hydrolase [Aquimarina sp. 2201CG5-10]|uniref:M20/M25/M40 family metallo-hydrolase n=1 Tax=Aquimarina callyspongiae TaxID=3098150 RepID=UPI002AB36F44|nr:M20/M25/M40 family metallo-hydrolase [Aquimarina sp. 2201CG5-10]MDY8137922.1 M20/M25/M40 family metallo-hydrolase [Aquimarina sp. 2201CG5-10]
MIRYTLIVLCTILSSYAQQVEDKHLDSLSLTHAKASFDELIDLLSIPNDAHYPEDIEKNILWSEKAFKNRGYTTKRLITEKIPLLLARRDYKNAKKTILVYLQVDGQPVDTSKWHQKNPYKATLKEQDTQGSWSTLPLSKLKSEPINPDWRIFARSASDAKGPVLMFLKAMDIINNADYTPNYNIKVILDFEEELGSPRLPKAVLDYKKDLAADMLVIFDGPRHSSNQPTLTYGARGITTLSLEVFGPRAPQHSGHYGNYVPNPALKLSQLLSSMMNEDGSVAIPGWYDGIEISEKVKKILKQVPDDENVIRKKLGIATIDNIANTYQESIQYPSLGILGLKSAWVGKERRTVIPASAIAEMNIRLVKETDATRMVNLVKQHIIGKGYHIIDNIPTESERLTHSKIVRFNYNIAYDAFRTDFDTEIGQWLRKAMKRAFGAPPIEIRTGGGSIPISPFVNTLKIPAVIVPTVNKDNNQHSPNENIRLGNYIDGIKTITAILTEKL